MVFSGMRVEFSSLRVRFLKHFYAWRVSLFLIGVLVSNRFANYSISGVYMDFLTSQWNTPIYAAAVVINLKEVLTSLFSIVGATYATHARFGRYHAIRLSLLPFVTGLGLFASAALVKKGGPSIALFSLSMILTVVGEGMQRSILFDFGYDQFENQMEDKKKAKFQARIWWNAGLLAGTVGGLTASTLLTELLRESITKKYWWVFGGIVSCGLAVVTSIIFILGKRSFHKARIGGKSPIIDVLKVVVAAARKRHLAYATDPSSIYEEGRKPTLKSQLMDETSGSTTQGEAIQTLTKGTEIMIEMKNQVEAIHAPAAHGKMRYIEKASIKESPARIDSIRKRHLPYATDPSSIYEDGRVRTIQQPQMNSAHEISGNKTQREAMRMTEETREIVIEENNQFERQGLTGDHAPALCSLRWLEKASIIESPALIGTHERQWKLCSLTSVKNAALVLRLLPLWSTFLMFQIVIAMGDTFFLEQGITMQSNISSVNVREAILLAVQNGSHLLIGKLFKTGIPPLVRIGIGLFISISCCIVAGVVELRRLHHVVPDESKADPYESEADMSIFWLVPQCFLLGAAGGFTEDGISEFFDSRVPPKLRVCYRLTSESVRLVGCLLNSLVLAAVHFFSRLGSGHDWIGDDINTGKLYRLYFMIAGLSTMNLFFYYYISRKYGSSQDQIPSISADHGRPKEGQSKLPTQQPDDNYIDDPNLEDIDIG